MKEKDYYEKGRRLLRLTCLLLLATLFHLDMFASNKTVKELPLTAGSELSNGIIYKVSKSATITGGTGESALKVADGARVTIYIPKGVTLTVNGGAGSWRTGGGAGISVPSNSTLIITGEGTLNAKGGKLGYGSSGYTGGDAWLGIKENSGYGGSGGTGGAGGGGSGAAIGTAGGSGAYSQAGPSGNLRYCNGDDFDGDGTIGKNSQEGYAAGTMGNVYFIRKITVNLYLDMPSPYYAPAGSGRGNWATDAGSGWHNNYTAGAGGAGGGGGSGYKPLYAIGAGGSGGQCGATGGSGGTMKNSDGRSDLYGGGGAGGGGCWAGNSNSEKCQGAYGKSGGAGGSRSSHYTYGGNGSVYAMTSVKINDNSGLTSRGASSITSNLDDLKLVYTFDSEGKKVTKIFYYADPYSSVPVPTPSASNMFFEGYFTAATGGTKMFDRMGNPTSELCLEDKDLTLYAHWIKDTWMISTADELKAFIDATNDSHQFIKGVLMNDIDAKNVQWAGNYKDGTKPFEGSFDGQFHTISNLNLHNTGNSYTGMFPLLGSNSVVKNVILNNVTITFTTKNNIANGAFAGLCAGTLENCGLTGSISIGTAKNLHGLIGHSNNAKIIKCISSTEKLYSGLHNSNGITIKESYANNSENASKMKSGEIAYLLNHKGHLPWRQNLTGTVDPTPVFFADHDKVEYDRKTEKYYNLSYLMLPDGVNVCTDFKPTNKTSVIAHLGFGPLESNAYASTLFGALGNDNGKFAFVLNKDGDTFKAKASYLNQAATAEETIIIDDTFDTYATYDRYIGMSRQEVYMDSSLVVPVHDFFAKSARENFTTTSKEPLYIGSRDKANASTPLYVHEFDVMDGGVLMHRFFPSNFNNQIGLYDVVKNTFCVVSDEKNAKLHIPYCDHRYSVQEIRDGVEFTHCCICNKIEANANYRFIHYEANVAADIKVDGLMGDELLISNKLTTDFQRIRKNEYRRPMYQFEGWNTQADGKGTSYSDGCNIEISAEKSGSMTLYAQWTPCYSVNGDTIKIPGTKVVDEVVIRDDATNRYGFVTAETINVTNFDYIRTMPDSCRWGTICMPVDLKSDTKVQYYLTGDVVNDKITLHPADIVPANTPCIFRLAKGVNELHITGSKVTFDGNITNPMPTVGNIHLFGTYEYQDFKCIGAEPYYGIQNDKFYHVASSMVVRPFRAYFRLKEIPQKAKPLLYIYNEEDENPETTGIEDTVEQSIKVEQVIDLNGRLKKSLGKGINIIRYSNGMIKKVYVK